MTESALAEVLMVLSKAYRVDFKAEEVKVWRLLLHELGDSEGREAAVAACRKYTKLPTPAVLCKLAEWSREERIHKLKVLEARENAKMLALAERTSPESAEEAKAAQMEIRELFANPSIGAREDRWVRGADRRWQKVQVVSTTPATALRNAQDASEEVPPTSGMGDP